MTAIYRDEGRRATTAGRRGRQDRSRLGRSLLLTPARGPPRLGSHGRATAADQGAEDLALAADLRAEPGRRTGRRRLGDIVWQAMVLDTPAERVRHLIARVLVLGGRDLDWLTVPRSLWVAYYLFRPLRLAGEHLRKAARAG